MSRLLPALIIASIVTGLFWLGVMLYRDHVWWENYRVERHCAPTGLEDQYVVMQPIYSSDGRGNMYVSSMVPVFHTRVQWRCDGGELLWRG